MATLQSSHGFMRHLQSSELELWLQRRPVLPSIPHWWDQRTCFCSMVKIYMVLILWRHQPLVQVTINLALFKSTYLPPSSCRALSSKDAVGTSATCWPKIKSLQNHAEVSILENFYNISETLAVHQRLAASTLQQRWQIQVQKVKSLPQFVFSL
ncbi:uncharacterized protein ACBT44_004089 [Syngnathus typhle]